MGLDTPEMEDRFAGLLSCGPLKAWSMVVTILGDLCRNDGDRVSGPVLTALMLRMGVSHQTLRVALHRLRRDGWIEGEKRGRVSDYRLTDTGRARTEEVRARIYARSIDTGMQALMAVAPPSMTQPAFAEALPAGALLIAPRTALCAPGALAPDLLIQPLDGTRIPGWVVAQLVDDDTRTGYARLIAAVAAADVAHPPAGLAERAALRLLILHHWRRLQLRHGPLPDILLGQDWSGAEARHVVGNALEALPRPLPHELSAALG